VLRQQKLSEVDVRLLFRAAYNRFFARFGQGIDFTARIEVWRSDGAKNSTTKKGVKPADTKRMLPAFPLYISEDRRE
jgi:hypothetical protein